MTEFARWRTRAAALARVAVRSGALFEVRPASLWAALRMRLAGPLALPSLFRIHAASKPDAIAVVSDHRSWSFRELDERIDRLAAGLRDEHGIGPDDAVILVMPNRVEFLETQAALGRVGASAVSVSWRSTPSELEYLVGHAGGKAVVADASVLEPVASARPRLTTVPSSNFLVVGGTREGFASYDELLARSAPERIDGREGSVIIYTSGTTGRPKGAVRRFPENMAWAVIQLLDELGIRADDRHLAALPMYHSTAFAFIGFTLALGGTVVLESSFDPERFLATIEAQRITTAAVVPTMLHRLLELPPDVRSAYDTRSLTAIYCGGAPLSGDLARRTMEEFGHVLYNFYGSTETGLNTLATPEELLRAPGTIGHVIEGNDIRLLDEHGQEVAEGETGELWVKNEMLVSGYQHDESSTRASMRDGYFSVGDLAHRDADGLYHVDGRKHDVIISGGVNVYPAELEEVLSRHPDVSEVAVVGVPDEEWGERVRACIVPRRSLEEAELIAWSRRELSGPKAPREVRWLEKLPRNPTGKVLKQPLREMP